MCQLFVNNLVFILIPSHLLSLCVSSPMSIPNFFQIPITIQTPSAYKKDTLYSFPILLSPLTTRSFSKEITDEYITKSSVVVAEEIPESITESSSSSSLLEFQRLADLDLKASMQTDGWSQCRLLTTYPEFLTANPKDSTKMMDMEGGRVRYEIIISLIIISLII